MAWMERMETWMLRIFLFRYPTQACDTSKCSGWVWQPCLWSCKAMLEEPIRSTWWWGSLQRYFSDARKTGQQERKTYNTRNWLFPFSRKPSKCFFLLRRVATFHQNKKVRKRNMLCPDEFLKAATQLAPSIQGCIWASPTNIEKHLHNYSAHTSRLSPGDAGHLQLLQIGFKNCSA